MQEMESERDILLGTRGSSTFAGHDASRRVALTHRFTADAALSLVQRIFLRQTQPRPQLVVFAGVDHGNGCSEMAASVAESLAQNAPGAVCLVEANFRSPALATLFGTTNHHGLTEALLRETPIRQFIQPVCGDRMWLLSSGSLALNSAHLLISARLRERFTELRSAFDFVIVDAPPMTRYADAIVLGKSADGVVLVVEAEATRKEAARTAVDNLRSSDIPILGAVLNKRTFPIPAQIYKRL
jgi:receptor protein-tyrosine kinase